MGRIMDGGDGDEGCVKQGYGWSLMMMGSWW